MAEEMAECTTCGAAVVDEVKHQQWHGQVDDIESTAEEALDRAEQAQNVLYQNNIQV